MKRAPVAESWDALIERFDKFAVDALSVGFWTRHGPQNCQRDGSREGASATGRGINKAILPRRPHKLTQRHVEMLKSMKTSGRGPAHRALWNGLWRAIIFDCDNYTCYFCYRSGERGVEIPKCGHLALRLQLDHVDCRSYGGPDYHLANIRTTCRLCNQGRFRLSEEHFRLELASLAKSVCAGPIRK